MASGAEGKYLPPRNGIPFPKPIGLTGAIKRHAVLTVFFQQHINRNEGGIQVARHHCSGSE
jgi:hypothetical protein